MMSQSFSELVVIVGQLVQPPSVNETLTFTDGPFWDADARARLFDRAKSLPRPAQLITRRARHQRTRSMPASQPASEKPK